MHFKPTSANKDIAKIEDAWKHDDADPNRQPTYDRLDARLLDNGSPPTRPPWAIALSDLVWTVGDTLVLVGTILMWRRKSVGRMLATIGLSMVVASTLGVELAAWSTSLRIIVTPLAYLINVFTVLSLTLALLPDTSRYLKAGAPH